jgi:thioredoxin 1
MAELEISGNEFEAVLESPIVVVDFFAEWCMPCLMMAPIIEELAEKFEGKIRFAKINVDENSELSERFGIGSIPTLIVFKGGKSVEKITGSLPIEILEEKLKKHL